MKRIILLIMFLIVLIPIVNSGSVPDTTISSYILEENFNTTGLYTDIPMKSRDEDSSNNWALSTGGCGSDGAYNLNPRNSSWDEYIFDDFSFGTNYTTACPFSSTLSLSGNLPINTTDSIIVIKYNLAIQSHNAANNPLGISFHSYNNFSHALTFTHGRNTSGIAPYNAAATTLGNNCNLSLTSDIPQTHEFTIVIDQRLKTYSWYADGVNDGKCDNVNLAGNNIEKLGLGSIIITTRVEQNIFIEVYFDDLEITVSTSKSKILSIQDTSRLTINSEGKLIMKK